MSTTLNFFSRLLAAARSRIDVHRPEDAARTLHRLLRMRDLPPDVASEAHRALGGLYLDADRPRRARRHLLAAAALAPDDAETRFLLGCAIERDPKGDAHRAFRNYRRALNARPREPRYLLAFGRLALRLGKDRVALQALRRSARLRRDEPEHVEAYADALALVGRGEASRQELLAARFRYPHDARFAKLWADFRFDQVRDGQQKARVIPMHRPDDGPAPRILRFPAATSVPLRAAGAEGVLRLDRVSRQSPHLPRLLAFRPNKNRAPD
jgi:tetratricopeptide (TPR) repeat protein